MTTATTTLAMTNSSDASFRAWGLWMSNTLTTFGFPKTSDTGQVDWTTVTHPSSLGVGGYEIRRFNDSLSSGTPIYMKLEWASGSNANTPDLFITIGTGSNGSGTITGTNTSTRVSVTNSAQAVSGTTGNVYAWSDGASAFGFLMWPGTESTNGGYFFGVERFRDNTGAATADGVSLYNATGGSSGTSANQRMLPLYSGYPNVSGASTWLVIAPSGGLTTTTSQSAALGTTLYPQPVFSGWTNRLYGPSQMLLAVGQSDLTVGSTFTLAHYGTSRTWLAAGPNNSAGSYWSSGINLSAAVNLRSFAMRWD